MKKDNSAEIFPIVTESGEVIGSATRGECHNGSMILHPVVHLHIFDANGNLYLQKRPDWKDVQPGKWDTAVGGHVDYGEEVESALIREAAEEVGITVVNPAFLKRYVFESAIERELVNTYKVITEECPTPSEELDGGRFWSKEDILNNLGKGIFTPNFEKEYKMLFIDSE